MVPQVLDDDVQLDLPRLPAEVGLFVLDNLIFDSESFFFQDFDNVATPLALPLLEATAPSSSSDEEAGGGENNVLSSKAASKAFLFV